MSNKRVRYIACAAAVAASLISGTAILSIRAAAAAAAGQPRVEEELGGGAPTKVLEDNGSMRVTLISYPAGFRREGGLRRRMEQLIVYVDDGDFQVIHSSDAKTRSPAAAPGQRGPESSITPDGGLTKNGFHPQGTVAWHPKDSLTPTIVTRRAYRALFIELKK